MIFIMDFQFQVHLMYLSGCQMGQSPMGLKMNLERRRRVQFGIFLNQGVGFEYTQLLPGFEMIQLILGAKRTPLLSTIQIAFFAAAWLCFMHACNENNMESKYFCRGYNISVTGNSVQ